MDITCLRIESLTADERRALDCMVLSCAKSDADAKNTHVQVLKDGHVEFLLPGDESPKCFDAASLKMAARVVQMLRRLPPIDMMPLPKMEPCLHCQRPTEIPVNSPRMYRHPFLCKGCRDAGWALDDCGGLVFVKNGARLNELSTR